MKEKKTFYTKFLSMRWIFNSLMLWSALLGIVIGMGYSTIRDTLKHKGSCIISSEVGGDEQASEDECKREGYGNGGIALFFGFVFWLALASSAKKDADEKAATKEYLDAKIKTNAALEAAFAKVMGIDAYRSVAAEAIKDTAYQAATVTESAKFIAYNAAAEAAKGDEKT